MPQPGLLLNPSGPGADRASWSRHNPKGDRNDHPYFPGHDPSGKGSGVRKVLSRHRHPADARDTRARIGLAGFATQRQSVGLLHGDAVEGPRRSQSLRGRKLRRRTHPSGGSRTRAGQNHHSLRIRWRLSTASTIAGDALSQRGDQRVAFEDAAVQHPKENVGRRRRACFSANVLLRNRNLGFGRLGRNRCGRYRRCRRGPGRGIDDRSAASARIRGNQRERDAGREEGHR